MRRLIALCLGSLVAILGPACVSSGVLRPYRPAIVEKTIEYVDGAVDPQSSHWAPWYRVQDDFDLREQGAFYFAVAQDGSACVIPGAVMPMLHRGSRLGCEANQWRMQGRNPLLRRVAFVDTNWVQVGARDGTGGRVRLPAVRSDSGTFLVLIQLAPQPGDTIFESGVIELDCRGRARYPHDALFNANGDLLSDLPIMTWDIVAPHTILAHIELLACPTIA